MASYSRNYFDIRAVHHPKRKRFVKQQINRKRRQLLKEGLKDIKQSYNCGADIDTIDYYRDEEFIKIMSRQGTDADYIEKRTTGSRITIASCW